MLDDEAVGYLQRGIVTPVVYPRLVEFLYFDIRSTGHYFFRSHNEIRSIFDTSGIDEDKKLGKH
jgi:hypothetical protein